MNTDAPESPDSPNSAPDKEAAGGIVSPPTSPSYLPMGFWLMVLILLTLIFSTLRDVAALNEQIGILKTQNAPGLELLKRSAKQGEFVERVHTDLQQLASTNSTATQLLKEYFGSPAPASPKPASPNTNGAPAAPAK